MAQRIAQTVVRLSNSASTLTSSSGNGLNSRLLNARYRSGGSSRKDGKNGEGSLVEVDLESGETEIEVFGVKRLEDAIHGIIVRRSAPDWLPFLPGASYWVPPRKNHGGLVDLIGRLSNPLTEEETLSFSTARGWPSSAYYIEGASPHPAETTSSQKKEPEEEEEG